jgi:O-antigen ligase
MQQVLAWALAVVPLFITPGLTFYFDVIPRLSLLLVLVSTLLLFRTDLPEVLRSLCNTSTGRWLCALAAVHAVTLIVSSLLSENVWLSVYGSTWRRFGLLTQLALLILTVGLAADLHRNRAGIRHLLRAFATCGLVAAIYGVFQYFGKDPLLDTSRYHIGEGVWAIVRPPGTLGHASYFAVYLLMVAFSAAALMTIDYSRRWRILSAFTMAFSAGAIVLTGTRAALVGGVLGVIVTAVRLRPRLTRGHLAAATAVACAIVGFYLSPAGERLRARVRWSTEDLHGGARLWLWRDSLRMAAERPILGYGPEAFGVQFPRFQSVELARAYPDFHHESPHNMQIDALIAQGLPGAAALGMLIAGAVAGLRATIERRRTSAVLLGCLTALAIAQQFVSLTVPIALCFSVTVACLLSFAPAAIQKYPARHPVLWRLAAVAIAVVLCGYALRLAAADWLLESVRDNVADGNIAVAAERYSKASQWLPPGASADLYYSRSMAAAATKSSDAVSSAQAWQQAITAGANAVTTSDQPANAAYNLAALRAAANDVASTEASLRTAISKAPNWFKPHWMLARVLSLSGRVQEAEGAAAAAVERNGGVNPEVLQTLQEIRQKASQPR